MKILTTPRVLLWSVSLALYLAFAFWYTNTNGPLRPKEIQHYLQKATEAGFQPEWIELVEAFMLSDTGRQFFMVNSIDLNDDPPDVDGADPGEAAPQLLGRYMEFMYPALLRRASHPVLIASAVSPALDLIGIEGAETWDLVVVMRYRSRKDLMEIVVTPEFSDKHPFKVAALTKTIAYPAESRIYLSDPRLLLALALTSLVALMDVVFFGRKRRRIHNN